MSLDVESALVHHNNSIPKDLRTCEELVLSETLIRNITALILN